MKAYQKEAGEMLPFCLELVNRFFLRNERTNWSQGIWLDHQQGFIIGFEDLAMLAPRWNGTQGEETISTLFLDHESH